MLTLPKDLKAFLDSGKQLVYDETDCHFGQVILQPAAELKLGKVAVYSQLVHVDDDPNAGKDGYYLVEAVSLVADCDDYEPDFALAWLPKKGVYGSWDFDHCAMTVFTKARWSDIVKDPLPFLNALRDEEIGEPLTPWPDYPFILDE